MNINSFDKMTDIVAFIIGYRLRNKDVSLNITWIKDKSLSDLDNLPDPDELEFDIIKNLEAGLGRLEKI